MSAFSFSLTLLLLGTIAAADTNHPVFWLSIGPAPLVGGFTIFNVLPKKIRPTRTFRDFWQAGRLLMGLSAEQTSI